MGEVPFGGGIPFLRGNTGQRSLCHRFCFWFPFETNQKGVPQKRDTPIGNPVLNARMGRNMNQQYRLLEAMRRLSHFEGLAHFSGKDIRLGLVWATPQK